MEGRPPFWLRLFLVACLLLAITRAEVGYADKLIKRSKRSLEDDVGDALYESPIVKREEIPVPKDSKITEDAEEDDSSVASKKSDASSASKRHIHQEKLTSAQNDVVMVKDEQTKEEEKAEENASLRSGMHSNIDHPFTNSGLTKQYRPQDDVDNGEIMGSSDEKRDSITQRTDSLASEEQQLLTETNDVLKLVQSNDKQNSLMKRSMIGRLSSLVKRDLSGERAKRDEHAVADTHDMQDGGAPSHFQVDDKSADLEINANSAGVKVKAKPASLQVVSRPGSHGHEMGHHHEMEMFHEPMMHYHHPHHHHHHHGHRRHHRPRHYDYDDYEEDYHHHEMPHFFDVPHYGSTWGHGIGGYGGGYGGEGDIGFGHGFARSLLGGMRQPSTPLEQAGYGRSLLGALRDPSPLLPSSREDVNGYGRSSIESVLTGGRLGASSSSLNLPDSELLLMERLRARLEEERVKERLRQEEKELDSSRLVDRIRNLESHYRDVLPERRSPLHPDRFSTHHLSRNDDDSLEDNLLGRYHSRSSFSRNRVPLRDLDRDFRKRDHFAGHHHGRHGHGIHYR